MKQKFLLNTLLLILTTSISQTHQNLFDLIQNKINQSQNKSQINLLSKNPITQKSFQKPLNKQNYIKKQFSEGIDDDTNMKEKYPRQNNEHNNNRESTEIKQKNQNLQREQSYQIKKTNGDKKKYGNNLNDLPDLENQFGDSASIQKKQIKNDKNLLNFEKMRFIEKPEQNDTKNISSNAKYTNIYKDQLMKMESLIQDISKDSQPSISSQQELNQLDYIKINKPYTQQSQLDLSNIIKKLASGESNMILAENLKLDTSHIEDLNKRINYQQSLLQNKEDENKNLRERNRILNKDNKNSLQDIIFQIQGQNSIQKSIDLESIVQINKNNQKLQREFLEKLNQIHKQISNNINNEEKQKLQLSNEVQSLKKVIKILQEEKLVIQKKVEIATHQEQYLKLNLTHKEQQIDSIKNKIRELKKKHEDLNEQKVEVEKIHQEQSLHLISQQGDLKQLQQQIDGQENQIENQQKNIQYLNRMIISTQNNKSLFLNQKKQNEQKFDSIQEQIQKQETEYEIQKRKKVNQLDEFKLQMEQQLQSLTNEYNFGLQQENKQKLRIQKLKQIGEKLKNQEV